MLGVLSADFPGRLALSLIVVNTCGREAHVGRPSVPNLFCIKISGLDHVGALIMEFEYSNGLWRGF